MIRGWTLAFLLIATGFVVGSRFTEPGFMAATLFACIGVLNEMLDPHP